MKKKTSKYLVKGKKRSGKKLYLFLMAVFTLVMIADLAAVFLIPGQSVMEFTPGGFDREAARPEGAQMPDGFTMPEGGFANGEAPEGMGDMPDGFSMPGGGFANGEAPEGMGEMPGSGSRPGGGRQGSILQILRRAWLPILIVCVLGDAVCLIALLRLRRREKAVQEAFSDVPLLPEDEEDSDEPPKRRRGSWMAILCLAVSFALILAMIPTDEEDGSSANVQEQVLSGIAEAAEIPAVLSGAGTLEADTLTPVTVPQQVTVLQYHVQNGETVSAGDPLVTVDKTSAASAMMELYDVMDELDEDLKAAQQKSNPTYLYSTASGRVKKIYAQEGDTVTDVLYEHGALMLLSLDGTMKITFLSSESLTVGEEVTVQYSGITETGRIASLREGRVTVTLSDETAWYGAEATVLDAAGKTLGQGTIEITNALKVIGYYGTVDGLSVSVDDKVSVGTTLLTLEDTGFTTDYQLLLARRGELEAQMQKLSQLAQTGMVTAENDGIISGVPEDAQISLLSGSGSGWQLMLLSDIQTDIPAVITEEPPAADPAPVITYRAGKVVSVDPAAGITVAYYDFALTDPDASLSGFTSVMGATLTIPYAEGVQAEDLIMMEFSDDAYSKIHRIEAAQKGIADGYYAAYLIQAAGNKLVIGMYTTALGDENASLAQLKPQMTHVDSFPFLGGNPIPFTENGVDYTDVMVKDLKPNDLLVVSFKNGGIDSIVRAQRVAAPTQGDQEQMSGGMVSGMSGGSTGGDTASGGAMGGFSGGMPSDGAMTVQESYEQYVVEEAELLYVSDQQEISVTISVDELDILTLKSGLEAQITLDAVKGQSFTGRVARISSEGTNDGGNTKFTATILLPREAMMLDGMNASVKVVTSTSQAAVTIPSAALVEEDGKTYVYTAYDEESDTLGGLTEVVTGASDGELVEILSGLEAGDPFYYRYADTVTYRFLTSL